MAAAPVNLTSEVKSLPRLALIADVSAEQAGGGALLLYRLLKDYPADRLMVVFNPDHLSNGSPAARIPGIEYRPFRYHIPRLVRNRLTPAWPVIMSQLIRWHTKRILQEVRDFAPEAILTVPHWYLWFAAASVARKLDVPLHLIVHDDWPSYQTFRRSGVLWDAVRWGARRAMGRVYRQAITRLCVSPGMMEQCQEWFGFSGTLLYPSRGEDSPKCRVRVRLVSEGPPVVAFCGQIHQHGTADALRILAEVLAEMGGRLDLYTMISEEGLASWGLGATTIRNCGFFPAAEMGERVGQTAHALFLPASFQPRERVDVATLFPSKLADYTAIGLPVLIWGPVYCSAARWEMDNPGAAIRITDANPALLRQAIARLIAEPDYAVRIAAAGIEAGKRSFDLSAAQQIFRSALRAAHETRPSTYYRLRGASNTPKLSQAEESAGNGHSH